MTTTPFGTMLAAATWTVLAAVAPAQETPEPARFAWQHDLDSARALAKQRGAPLFVVFRCER